MSDENPLWTTEQVAEFLGFPVSTIKRWRRIRMLRQEMESCNERPREEYEAEIAKIMGPKMAGPPFMMIGARKVRYRKSDVIAWAEDPI